MYLGCKIHPTSLIIAQPIYLSTAVVFALYSIRGYRITAGLFIGGVLAYYSTNSINLLACMVNTVQILFCAFLIRFLLDKSHMALVSMRNQKEILTFIFLSILIPPFIFQSLVTGWGHTLGLLTITTLFLVWDAYVPKISPPPQTKLTFLLTFSLWLVIGAISYQFYDLIYNLPPTILFPTALIMSAAYIFTLIILVIILAKLSNRFFHVIGLSFIGLSVLFYAIVRPQIISSLNLHTIYIQTSIIIISTFWLCFLATLR